MVSQIPLYSRGLPLKNLISNFKKQYPSTEGQLVINWDYGLDEPIKVELTDEEKLLYNSFVDMWYFADIGFDSTNEFIYRFNAVWKNEIHKYLQLLSIEKKVGLGVSMKELDNSNDKTGEDKITKTGTKSSSFTKSGNDTMKKGVTTTSSQETSNTGNKLARVTPNEQLTVTGDSTTTVVDSGQDETIYSETHSTTETPNYVDTYKFDNTNHIVGSEKSVKLSADEYKNLLKVRSILKDFALCFEKLFMEVFD